MSVAAPLAAPPPVRRRTAAGAVSKPPALGGVSWDDYVRFRDDPANEGVRLTYDQPSGRLEVGMPLGERHENVSRLLAALLFTFARVRRIPVKPVGSTTWRQSGVGGVEGDEAFYVTRFEEARGRIGNVPDLDGGDVPPDLIIEVDVTSPGVDKLPIYAGIGVSEVWVWQEDAITAYRLGDEGYQIVEQSVELPGFPLAFAAELAANRSDAATFELEEAFAERLRAAD